MRHVVSAPRLQTAGHSVTRRSWTMRPWKEWLAPWILGTVRADQSRQLKRCAVLVDGDGTPPKIADALIEHASRHGVITVTRVYGNFASQSNGWAQPVRTYAMRALQTYS